MGNRRNKINLLSLMLSVSIVASEEHANIMTPVRNQLHK